MVRAIDDRATCAQQRGPPAGERVVQSAASIASPANTGKRRPIPARAGISAVCRHLRRRRRAAICGNRRCGRSPDVFRWPRRERRRSSEGVRDDGCRRGAGERPKPSCEDCYFRCNLLCALDLDEPCATFRPDQPEGLRPPRQLRFHFRQPSAARTAAWAFPSAAGAGRAARLSAGPRRVRVGGMKIRAAVLEEFGQPLVVQEVDLDGPEAGRGARAARAPAASATPTCTPRRAPTRRATRRRCSATRAPASSRRSARASTTSPSATTSSRCSRRSAASACTAAARQTNLCLAIREQQNLGYLPDGTTRLHRGGERDPPLHGHDHVRRGDGDARDRAGQGRPGGAAGRRLHAGLRRDHRHRRGALRRQGRARLDLRGVRRGPRRPRRGRRRAAGRRRADHLRRPRRGAAGAARAHGATDTFIGGDDAVAADPRR